MLYQYRNFDYQFSEDDVVNDSNFIPSEPFCFNPHNVHPFILHDAGFVVAVVFESNLQDALDSAVDADKLDRFQVSESDYAAMSEDERERLAHLGNASEPFDIEGLDVVEVANAEWTHKYWTHEQLQARLESAGDSRGLTVQPIGSCGMTEPAIDAELAAVRACLVELASRK